MPDDFDRLLDAPPTVARCTICAGGDPFVALIDRWIARKLAGTTDLSVAKMHEHFQGMGGMAHWPIRSVSTLKNHLKNCRRADYEKIRSLPGFRK